LIAKAPYFSKTDISNTGIDKDFEARVIELDTESPKLIILSLYRLPTFYFNQFIKNVYDALKNLYEPNAEF
jgi:hypothetical protein